jgi:Uri superfamily endonuclease
MLSRSGTYIVVLKSIIERPVTVGKLGTLSVNPGYYVYIGSAFGPGGLKARIKHHCNPTRRPHWHLDYLSPILRLCEIWYTYDKIQREHQWAAIHAQTRGALQPLSGFGASDCCCRSHLFFYQSKPSGSHFRRKVRVKFDDHAKLMIEKSPNFLNSSAFLSAGF